MPINSRNKGKTYELQIIKLLKDMGFNCVSSRSESKRKDDQGIDICYTDPFQIQAKAVENLGPYHNVLAKMPREAGKYNLVFHKRNRQGTVVAMTQEDFVEILQMLIKENIIKPN
jgi:hypothetical protein